MVSTLITHLSNSALLFPGQGSQQVGMAKALVDTYPAAKAAFDEADEVLGFSLSQLCFEGPEATLTDTVNAQPALLAASIATLRAIESALSSLSHTEGTNVFVAGHSLGEYTALVAAGSLSYADGLRLVRVRGELMKEAGEKLPGMMAAVLGLDEERVTTICQEATAEGGIAQIANDNCPGQLVISGDKAGMEKTMAALSKAGAKKVVPLAVSIASHSPLMQPAAEQLRAAIEATPILPPSVPLIANTSATPLTDVTAIRNELIAQLTGSVRWTTSMQWAVAQGVKQFVEIGPGEVLSGLMKRIERSAERLTINQPETLEQFVTTIGGQ